MKKVLFTAIAAVAMMAMVACNNNKPAEANTDTTAVAEQCDKAACDQACTDSCMCGEECAAKKCEGCPNHGTENCCKAKAAAEGHACCEKQEGEHKCAKAEGKECCKKAEGKECEHKCQK